MANEPSVFEPLKFYCNYHLPDTQSLQDLLDDPRIFVILERVNSSYSRMNTIKQQYIIQQFKDEARF